MTPSALRQLPRIPAVEVDDVHRSLPSGSERVSILNGVSFTIARGEWVALTGPSGSGKSTLLGLIAGLDTPTSGRVLIDGEDITELGEGSLARLRNAKIGMIFQSYNLIPALTARENVEAPLHVGPRARQACERAAAMLDRVGLADRHHHRPHQLSGGQQQRVAIARALVTSPSLLVADEPTGNLDSGAGALVLDLIGNLRADLNLTVVMVTHDPAVAARADRVLRLVDGRLADETVVASGPVITRGGAS